MNERSIFLAALDLDDPAGRVAYLDQACGADADLRGRIDRLLAAYAAPGSFLDRPAADHATPEFRPADAGPHPAADVRAGDVLAGRYEIVREIGRGGMGAVYLARQVRPLRRLVAVKLIQSGTGTREVLSRFEAERQALAIMDHPNIAKVLDAGTTAAGRPFFVMELVDGQPLTKYCDAKRLPVADRLALFRAICRAVEHAHQKGVIHRDLKPGNILVETRDGTAVPKVIDFGLAKAVGGVPLTEETLFTVEGAVAGTPLYMAPEQTDGRGDVDTRADVYALGAVLYELLAGTTPIGREVFKQAILPELLRLIREDEPPAPSRRLAADAEGVAAHRGTDPVRLGRLVRGDLDWVTMKALEKDRGRRYDSAAALGADVDRFLRHEPVAAGPPTRAYRLRKFARRNRAAVTAAGLVVVALVAGVVGTAWGLVRARAEQAKAERAADQATQALTTLTDDVLKDFLGRRAAWGDREREFIRTVRGQFERLAAVDGDGPDVRRRRAAAQARLGLVQILLGDAAAGETDLRASIAGFEAFDDEAARREAANTRRMLGGVLADGGRLSEALVEQIAARAAFERLAADFPTDARYPYGAALAGNDAGIATLRAGRLTDAEANFRSAARTFGLLLAATPNDFDYLRERGRALVNLSLVLYRQKRLPESESAVRDALPLLRQAVVVSRDPFLQLELGRALATTADLTGERNFAEAEPFLRESLTIVARLAADYPAVPEFRNELALGHTRLARVYALTDRVKDAEAAYREAIAVSRRLADAHPAVPEYRHWLAANRSTLGVILSDTGRGPEAEATLSDALTGWEKLHADVPSSPVYLAGLVKTQAQLGQAAERRKDYAHAKAVFERADTAYRANATALAQTAEGPVIIWLIEKHFTRTLLGLGDHTAAAVRADRLAALTAPHAADNALDAGRYLARCADLAAKDQTLKAEDRRATADAYSDRAVAHLRTAVARGTADRKAYATDVDLLPLRDRPGFREFLAGLR